MTTAKRKGRTYRVWIAVARDGRPVSWTQSFQRQTVRAALDYWKWPASDIMAITKAILILDPPKPKRRKGER